MIQLETLTDADIGRKVIFTYAHGEEVQGVITSWNAVNVFVRFEGLHSEACDPRNPSWKGEVANA